jgi:hypothetical protein
MLSWQVGRVKITRIVEMDLPVPATVFPQATAAELRKSAWLYPHFVSEDDPCQMAHPDWGLDNDPKAAALTRSRLFAEWADQTILVIGTHFAAPTAGHIVRDGAAFRFAV